GEGLGLGVFKLGFLSEVHTDFILAGMTEEIGILGLLFICAIYFWLFLSLIKISANVQEKKYSLFIIGYTFCIAYSFLMNIFGILGFIPLKGIAVPFLSYGGSSMFANVFAITIILALYKTNNKKSFYKENS
ncbi:FtsW/RodA/SpoVE family cell cycle protein, partial [Campylobacter canadensis]